MASRIAAKAVTQIEPVPSVGQSKRGRPPSRRNLIEINSPAWRPPKAHRQLFDQIGAKLGFTKLEDWYTANQTVVAKNGGSTVFAQYYDNSLAIALRKIYPLHSWEEWRFPKVPKHFWNDILERRRYFDWLGKELNVGNDLANWYKISSDDVRERRGGTILRTYYREALWRALMDVYPLHPWQPWLFSRKRGWTILDMENQRYFLDFVAKRLQLTTHEGWYYVRRADHITAGVHYFLQRAYDSSLYAALKTVYPEHHWEQWRFPAQLSHINRALSEQDRAEEKRGQEQQTLPVD